MTPSKCRSRNTPRPCTISCKCHFFFAPPALSPAFAALAIEYSISACILLPSSTLSPKRNQNCHSPASCFRLMIAACASLARWNSGPDCVFFFFCRATMLACFLQEHPLVRGICGSGQGKLCALHALGPSTSKIFS
jgi:hypothetical protein